MLNHCSHPDDPPLLLCLLILAGTPTLNKSAFGIWCWLHKLTNRT